MGRRQVKYRIVLEFNSTKYDRASYSDEKFAQLPRKEQLRIASAELVDGLDGSESFKAPEFMKVIDIYEVNDPSPR